MIDSSSLRPLRRKVYITCHDDSSGLLTFSRPENLLQPLDKDIRMMSLEDQHRSQPDGPFARPTDVDPDPFHLLEDLIATRRVPRDEGALALTAKVLDLVREFLSQGRQLRVEVIARYGGVVDEVEALDLVDDGAEEESACRVAHPCVESCVRC